MFKNIKTRFKRFVTGEDLFSNLSILPFSKYKKNYSETDYLNAYEISLYLNVALNKRADKVGEIDFQLMKGDKDIEQHDLLNLLSKPNKSFTGNQFWALYQKYMDIYGEVYIYTDSELRLGGKTKITEMHLLRSDQVKPFFDKKTGELTRVEHNTADGTEPIEGEQIIYIHRPSPQNPLRGESLVASGMNQIETSVQIDEYQSSVLENGGRVEGVFNFKGEALTKTQLQEIKEGFQDEYGKAKKAGLPLFLSGGATYDKIALSPAEMAYLETKQVIFSDIVKLTGVPSALMGETSGETFANADASIRIFLRETIKPLLKALTNSLNENLVPEDMELTFIDPTPEDKEEKRKDIESGIKNYILTPNEAREMLGLDPMPEGDKLLAPFNIAPLENRELPQEAPQEKPQEAPQEEKQKKVKVASPSCRQQGESLEKCVSRKIPDLMDEGMSKDQAIAVANEVCSVSCRIAEAQEERKISFHPLRDTLNRRIYHSLCLKRLDRRQEKMDAVITNYFKGQEARIIEKLQGAKHFRKKDLFTEIFHTTLEIKLAKESSLPLLEALMVESAEDAKEVAGSDWEFNETPDINSWLDKKTSIFAEQINETTFSKLRGEFTDSFNQAESRKELIERIKGVYGNINDSRAKTIARTEVHGVTQYGTIQGYKQAGMPIKIWVWAPGTQGGVREDHQSMDGEEQPLKDSFSNGLMFPGDYSGGAGETINCQCFI